MRLIRAKPLGDKAMSVAEPQACFQVTQRKSENIL
jgi:hypothetical protein